jgi:hypothetical protein
MKRLRGLVAIAATFVGAASAAAQEATISAQDAERLVKIFLRRPYTAKLNRWTRAKPLYRTIIRSVPPAISQVRQRRALGANML